MPRNSHDHSSLSEGFGHLSQQTHDHVSATCQRIAALRSGVIDYANRHNAYVRDQRHAITGLHPGTCTAALSEITALFNTLGYSHALQTHANLHAGKTARIFRETESTQRLRAQWPALLEKAKLTALKTMSQTMICEINSEEPLILNAPSLVKATLAEGVAMQVSTYTDAVSDMDFKIISVNRATLEHTDFDDIATSLWHEHMHVYMSALRDSFACGWITPAHELYEDVRKSATIQSFNILGNIILSHEAYRAEPEEKICYQSQNVFYRVLRYNPQAPAPQP